MVDWHRSLIILPNHKTAKKTGKPRTIVLIPQMLKLLLLIRRDENRPVKAELRRLLENAPGRKMLGSEVSKHMRRLGASIRSVYVARKAIGAIYKRIGGRGKLGRGWYILPDDAKEKPETTSDHIFVSSKLTPWTRTALGTKFQRLRKLIGLQKSAR